MTWVN